MPPNRSARPPNLPNPTFLLQNPKPEQIFFSSTKVLQEFRETFAEEFCNFDGRSGLL